MRKLNKIWQKKLPIVIRILKKESANFKSPVVGDFATGENAPFKILISTVLSLRTKDKTTEEASRRLFLRADDPSQMLRLSLSEIEKLIYPVGFYRVKAKNIHSICQSLLGQFAGQVPDDLEQLLSLQGVGRKTANLVITLGYGKYGICVDTHVHRISNRLGLVKTKTANDTESALRVILPKKYWIDFNNILVAYGQNICAPISPFCNSCKVSAYCQKEGVKSYR
jgi:endonuclease III